MEKVQRKFTKQIFHRAEIQLSYDEKLNYIGSDKLSNRRRVTDLLKIYEVVRNTIGSSKFLNCASRSRFTRDHYSMSRLPFCRTNS